MAMIYQVEACHSFERFAIAKLQEILISAKDADNQEPQATLEFILGEELGYEPALVEHILLDVGLVQNTKTAYDCIHGVNTMQVLVQAVEKFESQLVDIMSGEKIPEDLADDEDNSEDGDDGDNSEDDEDNSEDGDEPWQTQKRRGNVDAAILAVHVALAEGMNLEDVARRVKDAKRSGNRVVGLIDKLHLQEN
ncbi:hypothetical protein IFM89_025633, partial [Coptis chinensis]